MNIKKWEVAPLNKDRAAQAAEQYAIPSFLAMMLDIRGFFQREKAEELLGAGVPLSDPFLMKGMDRAAERIRQAVDGFEKIAVYGDYDADGVTSTAMVFTYLEAMGADVMYYIPQREGEGYGMNQTAVKALREEGVKLIVTVDNGISSVEEVDLANELGMDVVVTDHHQPQERLPDAVAIVDAYQPGDESPFKEFSGAGVALKLLMALEGGNTREVLEEYADLAALGTIGDVVPVLGENRTIVQAGVKMISRGGRPGVDALLERCFSGRELTATSLAFTVIPRINATGRMGSPQRAVRLLTCDDGEEAAGLAEEICGDNERRRQVEALIAEEAVVKIENTPELKYARVIVVSGPGWHHGVIGIVASRIAERFGKPCFVISEDGEEAKGSGRSIEGFSLFQAVSFCGDLLERFGGHPMAAGLSLRTANIPLFRKRINEYAQRICPEMPVPTLRLDCRLNPATLSVDMPAALKRLEPFGSGNPQPLFGLYGMELSKIVPVGGGNHLRLVCAKRGAKVNCMLFGMRLEDFPFSPGVKVDLAVTLDSRIYRNEPELTITVRELKISSLDMEEWIHSYRLYEKFRRREPLKKEEADLLIPSREQLAALYRLLVSYKGSAFGMQGLLETLVPKGFNLGRLFICFDILEERRLIQCGSREGCISARVLQTEGKVDIFASPVFSGLRALAKG